ATESGGAYQHQPSVCAPNPYLSADSAPAQGSPHHGGGGRGRRQAAAVGTFLRLDLRHHARALPVPIATFQTAGPDLARSPQSPMSGCHQPSERFRGTVIPFAWFAQGLRLVDIADPFAPREVGHFLPDPADGEDRPSSNDVTVDDRGLISRGSRPRG